MDVKQESKQSVVLYSWHLLERTSNVFSLMCGLATMRRTALNCNERQTQRFAPTEYGLLDFYRNLVFAQSRFDVEKEIRYTTTEDKKGVARTLIGLATGSTVTSLWCHHHCRN